MGQYATVDDCGPSPGLEADPVDATSAGNQSSGNGQGACSTQHAVTDHACRNRGARNDVGKVRLAFENVLAADTKIDTLESVDIMPDVVVRNANVSTGSLC